MFIYPALKCLVEYCPYLEIQTDGRTAIFAQDDESEVMAIGVEADPMVAGINVKMQISCLAIRFPMAQEYLGRLQSCLAQYAIQVCQQPPYTVIFELTAASILKKNGHFIPGRLEPFLFEYDELLHISQTARQVLDRCAGEVDSMMNACVKDLVELTIFGGIDNVTVH